MTDHRDVPDEVKWRLAAACAATLPAMYDTAFRSIVGERYDEIEQDIWMDLSRTVARIARDLSLPVDTAHDLAETMRTVQTILFGPDFMSETLDISADGAVILTKRCPLLEHGNTTGAEGSCIFHKCLALSLPAIPFMNKKYTARFVRTMCTGDRQCEIKVEIEKQPKTTVKSQKK
jgi:hypothetical protein